MQLIMVVTYLVPGHGAHNDGVHDAGQSAHSGSNGHQNAGVAWGQIQMVDLPACHQAEKHWS